MKTLYSVEMMLYRRLDASYYDVARQEMIAVKHENAHLDGPGVSWTLKLDEPTSGAFARLQIQAVDRNAFYVSPGIVVALFLLVSVILSAIFGWGWE